VNDRLLITLLEDLLCIFCFVDERFALNWVIRAPEIVSAKCQKLLKSVDFFLKI